MSWTANSNVTPLFEGEPGHLVPSASHFLVESDMFMVAGRMLGHSFLHGGPCLSGLSPAVVHVLLGGSPETATVTLEDCPDLDIRETIRLVCLIKKNNSVMSLMLYFMHNGAPFYCVSIVPDEWRLYMANSSLSNEERVNEICNT